MTRMERLPHRVHDFVWRGDAFQRREEFLPTPEVVRDGASLCEWAARLRGQFALHHTTAEGVEVLARDPLGVNKLFFARREDGSLESANFLIDLVRAGHPLESLWSVPSGHVLRVDPARHDWSLKACSPLAFGTDAPTITAAEALAEAERVRDGLEKTFMRLKAATSGRPLYVTLSGGLDSTVMAVLARESLGVFTALTFDRGDAPQASEDIRFAERVAAELGVPHVLIRPSDDELLASLDEVLLYGQDWRDFNVHCGLVNHAIARAVAARHSASGEARAIVISGDGMNELMADYSPIEYAGSTHYRLPRMKPGRLRRFLVAGLDTGDREVGIFAQHEIDVLQPYLIAAEMYTKVPEALVGTDGAKQAFVRQVMGDRVPEAIYDRPKVRAQIGSADEVGGTLALLISRGWDSQKLAERFAELYGGDVARLGELIRAGFYRSTAVEPER